MSSIHDVKQTDVELVEESSSHDEDRTEEETALVRKIDLYLLPTMWVMYLLSYMDVSLLGNKDPDEFLSQTTSAPT